MQRLNSDNVSNRFIGLLPLSFQSRLQRWYLLGKRLLTARSAIIAIPYVWLFVFFALPFFIVFKISIAELARSVPPFTAFSDWEDGLLTLHIYLGNYFRLLEDSLYVSAYLHSLWIALLTTIFCILIGYPLAWAIAHSHPSKRNVLLLLVILPSWTSFLIRIYAWKGILKQVEDSYLNTVLLSLGIIDSPLVLLQTNTAIMIGMVYAYLPFMVLPIYNALTKMDYTSIEAAQDLGAKPWTIFRYVVLPLSLNGVIAGSMLVFIPSVGEYVIPELLGASDNMMIGGVLAQEFFKNRDWPAASAVAVVMLAILIIPIVMFHRFQQRDQALTQSNYYKRDAKHQQNERK